LYHNLGGGRFEDVTQDAGLSVPGWNTSAAFADIDRDGFSDLYIVQYLQWGPEIAQACYEGYPRQTLESLNRAFANLGDEPLALRLRGTILMDLGEVESAVADIEHVARALPYDEITHYKLSAAYRRRGRIEDASICMQMYQQIHETRLEIQRITREASVRPLSDKQQRRLTQLHKELGNQSDAVDNSNDRRGA